MSKQTKIAVALIVVAAICIVFGITWEVLSARDVIASEFNTSIIFAIATFCGCFGAILSSQSAAKGKKDSDEK